MVYQLSYELKTQDWDYAPLFSYLENQLGSSAKHVLRDVWWIAIDNEVNIDETCASIREYMGEKDNMFFCRLTNADLNGWLPSNIWKWYNENKS